MKDIIKKCVISRYDENIKEPPFKTIIIDHIEVPQPQIDYCGEEFYERLTAGCRMKGYVLKFYTLSNEKEIDFEIVVY